MPVRLLNDIAWVGEALLVAGATEKRPDYLPSTAPRDTIHKLHPDSEETLINRETERHLCRRRQRDRPSLHTKYRQLSNSNLVAMQLRDHV
jgi:hypothetical protein